MNGQRRQEQGQGSNTQSELANAYDMLGVDANVTDAELKKAYPRLINQHHPDKLVSKGLPGDVMELADRKSTRLHSSHVRISYAVFCLTRYGQHRDIPSFPTRRSSDLKARARSGLKHSIRISQRL